MNYVTLKLIVLSHILFCVHSVQAADYGCSIDDVPLGSVKLSDFAEVSKKTILTCSEYVRPGYIDESGFCVSKEYLTKEVKIIKGRADFSFFGHRVFGEVELERDLSPYYSPFVGEMSESTSFASGRLSISFDQIKNRLEAQYFLSLYSAPVGQPSWISYTFKCREK